MASTFKFHSQVGEVVPWNAQYAFPVQATKVQKQVVKLPPKNGGTFSKNNIIRIEFPADNYLNVLNSVLQFDLSFPTQSGSYIQFQRGGAHNLFSRLRVLYGSLVIEDIQNYSTLVRIFTECGVQGDYIKSSGGILDGMYTSNTRELESKATGVAAGKYGDTVAIPNIALSTSNTYTDAAVNTAVNAVTAKLRTAFDLNDSAGQDLLAYGVSGQTAGLKRTFCLNLLSGLLTAKKLLPLKWMAAQLAIELTVSEEAAALLFDSGSTAPVYSLSNVNFIAEMLEFDSTYDQAFYMGLQQGGVPIKFSSWHFHSFTMSGTQQTVQIHERARSLKAAFAVIRHTENYDGLVDSDRFFHDVAAGYNSGVVAQTAAGKVTEFQWRVGGRYYPAQPVNADQGGAEAYTELLKAINALGDYTTASNITYKNWTTYGTTGADGEGSKFIMACEFENTDAMPGTIAGINAEEQSDIALTVKANAAASNKKLDVFMHYDSLIVVKDGNTVDLIL